MGCFVPLYNRVEQDDYEVAVVYSVAEEVVTDSEFVEEHLAAEEVVAESGGLEMRCLEEVVVEVEESTFVEIRSYGAVAEESEFQLVRFLQFQEGAMAGSVDVPTQ